MRNAFSVASSIPVTGMAQLQCPKEYFTDWTEVPTKLGPAFEHTAGNGALRPDAEQRRAVGAEGNSYTARGALFYLYWLGAGSCEAYGYGRDELCVPRSDALIEASSGVCPALRNPNVARVAVVC